MISMHSCVAWLLVAGLLTHADRVQIQDDNGAYSMQQRDLLKNDAWPAYTRGKGQYKFTLSDRDLKNGLSYYGSAERLRVAVDKMKRGKPVMLAAIGGSITSGQGCVDAPNWPKRLFDWASDQYGTNVSGNNGAVGGTLSSYMSLCHNIHVPREADIIFVEYSVNDVFHRDRDAAAAFSQPMRKSFERLLRKLLLYPNRPAVVLVHTYMWFHTVPHAGAFWSNAEREFGEFGLYYGLPMLSLKAAAYHHMVAGDPGFSIKAVRMNNKEALDGVSFYWDPIHPDGRTGSRMIGELAMNLIEHTEKDLLNRPLSNEEDGKWAAAALPPPMIPKNWESASEKCFIGQTFTKTVQKKDGFEWVNEASGERPKWGMVSKKVGSVLELKIDTRTSQVAENEQPDSMNVLVELAYLKSYENMGQAKVSCISGCSCPSKVMNGHHRDRNSQLHLFNFHVSQHGECIIAVEVIDTTDSGQNKVKIAGVMVSEEIGGDGVRNHMAVEYVHDISSRSKDTVTFEVHNHV